VGGGGLFSGFAIGSLADMALYGHWNLKTMVSLKIKLTIAHCSIQLEGEGQYGVGGKSFRCYKIFKKRSKIV
jgi:hypothetical protein